MFYRGVDQHIHEIAWKGHGATVHTDLTIAARAAVTTWDPTSFVFGGVQHVVFIGNDRHAYDLSSEGAEWRLNDLTAATGAPLPYGGITAYASPDVAGILFRGEDNRSGDKQIFRISRMATTNWGMENLTSRIPSAPLAASDPMGYWSQHDGSHHVIFRTTAGHVWDLTGLVIGSVARARYHDGGRGPHPGQGGGPPLGRRSRARADRAAVRADGGDRRT